MKKSFNLTNATGLASASDWLQEVDLTDILVGGLFGALARRINAQVDPTKELRQAEKLIEAGRKNGVDEMEIRVSKETGARLKGGVSDAEVSVEGDSSNDVVVKVKYK
ncbi:MAG: hypothetical protein EP330_00935 [Deltaproteobacteria bacterium]|nr:MAG: hypothetical protein EP330_00935 [Deltaproteobacteria bacterium]